MEKPRLSYAAVFTKPEAPTFAEGSFAQMIQDFLEEEAKPGGRQYSSSRMYTMRRLQNAPLGKVQYEALKPLDFIDHCKMRRAAGILPQTINQDMTYASVVLRHAVEVWEMSDVGLLAYRRARPHIIKQQLICKAPTRDRLPTIDELNRLRALFVEQNKRPKNKIDMALVMDAELLTGRRISEITRIERQHVNVEKKTCWVYNLKNSKGKGYHAEFALIEGAWELFERRLKEIPEHPEARLFPFHAKSCEARYVEAKHELDIKGLRMHDNRAQCFVSLLDKGYSALQVRKGVSLHRNPNTFENVYARIKAEDLHNGPAADRSQA